MMSAFATALAACATSPQTVAAAPLTKNEVIDLMDHPRTWDGRVVTMKIFPFDNGLTQSYVVCFEQCDAAYAARSPFVIYTRPGRFRGLQGNTPVVVKARYSSACFYKSTLCPDQRFGLFTELN